MYPSPLAWRPAPCLARRGAIVAADSHREYLLKWFYHHYRIHHPQLPIAFFDLGMSCSARLFCEARGLTIAYNPRALGLSGQDQVEPRLQQEWERVYPGNIWKGRLAFLTKPFLCLNSPFESTLYFDLDCELRAPVETLFEYATGQSLFGIACLKLDEKEVYNTGVLAFTRFSPIIEKWAEITYLESKRFFGDEPSLLEVLYSREELVPNLFSILYNWPTAIDHSPQAAVLHHLGAAGKRKLFDQIISLPVDQAGSDS